MFQLNALMKEARTFFDLPETTKKKYSIRPVNEDERGGWVCLEQEWYTDNDVT